MQPGDDDVSVAASGSDAPLPEPGAESVAEPSALGVCPRSISCPATHALSPPAAASPAGVPRRSSIQDNRRIVWLGLR